MDEIYAVVKDFVSKVFSEKSQAVPFGPLNLTMGERNYINGFNGKAPLKEVQIAAKQNFLQRILAQKPEFKTEVVPDGEPTYTISIERLKSSFPCVFGFAHPKMADALRSNTLLNAKLKENQYGKDFSGTPGDF